MKQNTRLLLITCLTFVLIGLLLFFRSFDNSFVWDDESQIVKNTFIHNLNNLPYFFTGGTFYSGGRNELQGFYYKPIMTTFFSVLYSIFGSNPSAYHILQVLLHIGNSILVFLLFKMFFPYNLSLLMSIVFLVHPIQVETVVYAAALQDVLYFFFGLIAFHVSKKIKKLKYLPLVGLLLLLSALSKETGLLFLIIVPVYQYIYKRVNFKYSIATSTVVVGIYIYLRFVIAKVYPTTQWFNPMSQLTLIERITNIPSIVLFYLQTFIFPLNLTIARHTVIKNLNFTDFVLPLILLSFTACIFFKLYNINKNTGSKYYHAYLFFLLWFCLGIGLHLQIFPLDMSVADRWFYLPIVGLLGIISVPLLKLEEQKWIPIITLLILIFFLRSFIRVDDWQDSVTLFSHDITISKKSFDLENNLGAELIKNGSYKEAEIHLLRSISLAPDYWISWNNLGALYLKTGKLQKAKQAFISSFSKNRQYYSAQQNLVLLYLFYEKDPETARVLAEKAIKDFPANEKLWMYLAIANHIMGNKVKAQNAIEKSTSLQRTSENTYVYQQIINNGEIKLGY